LASTPASKRLRSRDDAARDPVLWAVSVSRLSTLIGDVVPEFGDRARIEMVNLGFEDAVRQVRRRAGEECDVLISAGSNGAYLKHRVDKPVVLIRASGFDLMQALSRARSLSDRIGVVTHETDMPAFAEFRRMFELPIEQRAFVTAEDARNRVAELVNRGVKAIVGTGLVVELAEQAGVSGLLLYSADSIRTAFESALDIAGLVRGSGSRERPAPRRAARRGGNPRAAADGFLGHSEAAVQVREAVAIYAGAEATVLIEGDTGTGKELVAQALHQASGRAANAFVAVNCGAVAESLLEAELFGYEEGAFTGSRRGGRIGLIESAHHGTLFLDEIGEMPLPLQTRLLRVLEEREVLRVGSSRPVPVDVRVIAATHRPVEEMVEEGGFRRDLYYRLNVLRIALPGLAQRRQDVAMLAEHFLQAGAQQAGEVIPELDASALALLEAHDWPGNVRELRNLMERLAVITRASGQLTIDAGLLQRHAPERTARPAPARVTRGAARRPDRAQLQQALQRCAGDRAHLAAQFGISRTTLWRWLREADLQ
jgi:transcriptional regulator, propionate catabolism operon regulatory protein